MEVLTNDYRWHRAVALAVSPNKHASDKGCGLGLGLGGCKAGLWLGSKSRPSPQPCFWRIIQPSLWRNLILSIWFISTKVISCFHTKCSMSFDENFLQLISRDLQFFRHLQFLVVPLLAELIANPPSKDFDLYSDVDKIKRRKCVRFFIPHSFTLDRIYLPEDL